MMASLLIDAAIVVLLLVVFVLFWQVRRGLEAVRSGQSELKSLVHSLNDATGKAQLAVQELRQAKDEAEETLGGRVARAKALADELTLITEAGDNLANRLEERLTGARARVDEQLSAQQDAGAEVKKSETNKGEDRGRILSALKEAR